MTNTMHVKDLIGSTILVESDSFTFMLNTNIVSDPDTCGEQRFIESRIA